MRKSATKGDFPIFCIVMLNCQRVNSSQLILLGGTSPSELIQEQSLAAIEALLETCDLEVFQASETAAIEASPIKDGTVSVLKGVPSGKQPLWYYGKFIIPLYYGKSPFFQWIIPLYYGRSPFFQLIIPLYYGTAPFSMDKSTIKSYNICKGAIFNSYFDKYPEGKSVMNGRTAPIVRRMMSFRRRRNPQNGCLRRKLQRHRSLVYQIALVRAGAFRLTTGNTGNLPVFIEVFPFSLYSVLPKLAWDRKLRAFDLIAVFLGSFWILLQNHGQFQLKLRTLAHRTVSNSLLNPTVLVEKPDVV